ncbi:MAG: ECF-type sigma factor [Verrucomicrobiales bacterium]
MDLALEENPEAVVALNDSLDELSRTQPELAEVVQLRFFAGLSLEETAKTLEISVPTVHRRWRLARTLLFESLEKQA